MAPSARAIALKGLFSEPYDRFRLPAAVVTALVDFFDGRGESVADLSLSCAASDLERFEAEWHGYAADATITSVGDQRKLTGWLSARMQSAAGAVTEKASGTAGVVINALEEIGRPLDGTEAASIRAKLAAKEKGEETDQCVGALCVAILYLGRAFKESEQKEYSAQFRFYIWEALRASLTSPGWSRTSNSTTQPKTEMCCLWSARCAAHPPRLTSLSDG